MPLPKYWCDYCERWFNDTPTARKKHFESKSHLMQKKMHYDSYKEVKVVISQVEKPPCQNLLKTGRCEYGKSCRYSHLLVNINGLYQANSLPPSMRPPPEEGYDPEEVTAAQWG